MPTVVGTVSETKVLTQGEKNGKPWKLWLVTVSDGTELKTFRGAIISQLEGFAEQPVEFEYEVTTRGDFTDNTITSVKLAPRQAVVEPEAQTPPERSVSPSNGTVGKDRQIARAVALKAAVGALDSAGYPSLDLWLTHVQQVAQGFEAWLLDSSVEVHGRTFDSDIEFPEPKEYVKEVANELPAGF